MFLIVCIHYGFLPSFVSSVSFPVAAISQVWMSRHTRGTKHGVKPLSAGILTISVVSFNLVPLFHFSPILKSSVNGDLIPCITLTCCSGDLSNKREP